MDTIDKETVSVGGTALEFARKLVADGFYANVSEAVSAVLEEERDRRAAEWRSIEKEVVKRRQTPRSEWIWPESDTYFEDRFRRECGKGGDET